MNKNELLEYILFLLIGGAVIFVLGWWATSPSVWYAGDSQYESLVKQAKETGGP